MLWPIRPAPRIPMERIGCPATPEIPNADSVAQGPLQFVGKIVCMMKSFPRLEHQRCANVKAQGNALGSVARNNTYDPKGRDSHHASHCAPLGLSSTLPFLFPRALPWALTLAHLWCSSN